MSRLHIPRCAHRQLVRVATVYLYPDEPAGHALARVEAIHPHPRAIQALRYTVTLLAGAYRGERHEVAAMTLAHYSTDRTG
jgi:hypothetical protein